jgi:hypothetical protein
MVSHGGGPFLFDTSAELVGALASGRNSRAIERSPVRFPGLGPLELIRYASLV